MRRIGVDIGGTFTDVIIVDDDREPQHLKVLTSTAAPDLAVTEALAQADTDLSDVVFFSHGTTIAINTIIERKGARTAVIATRGFADTLELRFGARTHLLDPLMEKPYCYVDGRWRYEVGERVLADGSIEKPLLKEELTRLARVLRREKIEAIAICFLHSYAFPDHERKAAAALCEELPDLYCTLSADIVPEIREFHRTSTAVLNAYCGPVIERYLMGLASALRARGLDRGYYVMQSNGGIIAAEDAARKPIAILESGPAAGVTAAAQIGRQLDLANVITFDMGGTTAKAAVIERGEALDTLDYELFGEYERPGSGWPIQLPMVDIVEAGSGGGSIAWVDPGGGLHVGPESAGSDPGPVCYGLGGGMPTVTDAFAVLGVVESLLGGSFVLDRRAARQAIQDELIAKLPGQLSVEVVAAGIVEIAAARAAEILREVTVARGRDPRDFVLMAYGGAGPLVACALLDELGIGEAIIPPSAGTFSAFGLLSADIVEDTSRTYVMELEDATGATADALLREMEAELRTRMSRHGAILLERSVDARYRGQYHQIRLRLAPGRVDANVVGDLAKAFHDEHERLYTYSLPAAPIEVVTLRARGRVEVTPPRSTAVGSFEERQRSAQRKIIFRGLGRVQCAVHWRAALLPGSEISGPAVIEEETATTLITPGYVGRSDEFGNLRLVAS